MRSRQSAAPARRIRPQSARSPPPSAERWWWYSWGVRFRCLRLNLAVLSSAARAPAIGRTPKWTRQIPESPTPAGRVRSARIEPMPDISAEVLTANVLIVDDEGADRRLMTAILEGAGYSHLASTG